MEKEIENFMLVWIIVISSLCYCHTIGKCINCCKKRLFAIIPIIFLFLYLPLTLTTIHLGATSAFLVAWLANFKLLLFAFGKPPLSSDPSLPLSHFILLSVLPIKIQQLDCIKKTKRPSFEYFAKRIVLLAIYIQVYKNKDFVHPKLIMLLICLYIYSALEIFLALLATAARAMARLELEPQFDEPYFSTSLQDFWGKRWNLMVTNILHPTVYDPVRSFSKSLVGSTWASLPAILATFFISGVMHELTFYYVGRTKPSFEVMWFFMIHGICLATEIGLKKTLKGKISQVPHYVSGPFVISFVLGTCLWLFIPPIIRCNADLKARRETAAIAEFVKSCFQIILTNVGYK